MISEILVIMPISSNTIYNQQILKCNFFSNRLTVQQLKKPQSCLCKINSDYGISWRISNPILSCFKSKRKCLWRSTRNCLFRINKGSENFFHSLRIQRLNNSKIIIIPRAILLHFFFVVFKRTTNSLPLLINQLLSLLTHRNYNPTKIASIIITLPTIILTLMILKIFLYLPLLQCA